MIFADKRKTRVQDVEYSFGKPVTNKAHAVALQRAGYVLADSAPAAPSLPSEEPTDLEAMSLKQLRAAASERGYDGAAGNDKQALIDFLKGE